MYDRAYAFATGAFIVLALAALFVTVYWLTGLDTERRPYVVVSSYSVAGLAEGSQLLYRGVPAGRVDRIRIDPEDPSRVLVTINVDAQIPVHYSTYARLQTRGLTGTTQVELHDAGDRPEPLPTSRQDPARIPMHPSLVDEVTDAGTQALATLNIIVDVIGEALDEENLEQIRAALRRVDNTLTAAEQVALALEAELPRTLQGAARTAEAVTVLAERATSSMDEVDELIAELRETAAVARQLGEDLAGRTQPGIDRALEAFDRAAQEIGRLAQSLARQPERLLRGSRLSPGPGEE
jgi:phospholipid/cholesterol/gamma-HCH transport system substrate-binding protein